MPYDYRVSRWDGGSDELRKPARWVHGAVVGCPPTQARQTPGGAGPGEILGRQKATAVVVAMARMGAFLLLVIASVVRADEAQVAAFSAPVAAVEVKQTPEAEPRAQQSPAAAASNIAPSMVAEAGHIPRSNALQLELESLRAERPSEVAPVVVMAVGLAASVVGGVLGLRAVVRDDPEAMSALASVLMLGGASVSIAGGVWWRWVYDWRADMERRERYLLTTHGAYARD